MSKYLGARYTGIDPIHLFDGNLICNGEVTDLLSEEAACNDNNFEPVYDYGEKKKIEKVVDNIIEPKIKKKIRKGGN